jgi:hypothetical protein
MQILFEKIIADPDIRWEKQLPHPMLFNSDKIIQESL